MSTPPQYAVRFKGVMSEYYDLDDAYEEAARLYDPCEPMPQLLDEQGRAYGNAGTMTEMITKLRR